MIIALAYLCALCEFFVPFVVDKIAADQKRHLHAVHGILLLPRLATKLGCAICQTLEKPH